VKLSLEKLYFFRILIQLHVEWVNTKLRILTLKIQDDLVTFVNCWDPNLTTKVKVYV
jgi:hypothetical protein